MSTVRQAYRDINAWRYGWLLLMVAAVLPTVLYWLAGYGGLDITFHATAWMELREAVRAHTWELGWSAGANHGLGSPRLTFYPPFDAVLSTVLSFALPVRLIPGMQVWLIHCAAGLNMYLVFGRLVGRDHRVSAAFFFMFSGYMLVLTIMHYDIAEAWVDAFAPFHFLFFYKIVQRNRKAAVIPAALLMGLAWLTNVPAAIVLFYTFGFTALGMALLRRRLAPLLWYASALAMSLAVAAFRLAPVFVEKKWIHPEAMLLYPFQADMLLRPIPPHVTFLYFLNLLTLTSCVLLLVGARQIGFGRDTRPCYLTPLAISVAVSVFLQLPVSAPFWLHLPELIFVAFSFRFQIFLMLAVPLVLFSTGTGKKLRFAGLATSLLLLAFPFLAFFHLPPADRLHSFAPTMQAWQSGYDDVLEYLPATVKFDPEHPLRAVDVLRSRAHKPAGCDASSKAESPNRQIWDVHAPVECQLIVGTFCYPYWHAQLEDGRVLPLHCSAESLIAANVPAGTHLVTLQFTPKSAIRTASGWVSAIALIVLAGAGLFFHANGKQAGRRLLASVS